MKKSVVIAVVVALIAAGAGFFGGMKYAQAKAQQQRGQRAQQFGGGNFVGGPGGGAGRNGNNFVSGQIIAQDSQSITVKMNNGSTKIVFVSGTTQILKSDAGTISDLAVGKNVVVTGAVNSDGSVNAQDVQIRPVGQTFSGPGGGQ